jgi:polyisoprenoid-binding protein YceI
MSMLRRLAILTVLALEPSVVRADPPTAYPPGLPAGAYVLDSRRANLVLKLPPVVGGAPASLRLTGLEGGFSYDPARWRATQVTIRADPRSVEEPDTAVGRLAVSLFEPDRYPTIEFRSATLSAGADGRGQLAGALTFHGVTRPLTLDVAFDGVSGDPAGEVRTRFSGRGRINRSDFGITIGHPFVGNDVELAFDIDFVRGPTPR